MDWLVYEVLYNVSVTHQIFPLFIVDARFFGCIANPLQNCCFASIGPSDYKNTKVMVFLASVEGV